MIAYAITDPSTLSFSTLDADLARFVAKGASMILYRDKNNPHYPSNALEFFKKAKKYPFEKILLHGDFDLASKLQVHGVHLRSDQLKDILQAKQKHLFVVASTHTFYDAKLAQALGADMITLSPIFYTPNKGKPIGIKTLQEISATIDIPILALGGILSTEQIDAVNLAGAKGFASIRFFS